MKNTNKKLRYNVTLLVLIFILPLQAYAQTPVGTGFSYQGELQDNGSPANGNYDIVVEPFIVANGGTAVPFTQNEFLNVPVVNGLFSLENVDFGDIIYLNSNAIWLELSIRNSAVGGNYTLLAPRQRIKAVPYTVQSEFANEADSAITAVTANKANDLSISGASIGDVLAYNGVTWSWSSSVSVNGNGGATIGSNLVAPSNGLKVAGNSEFDGDLSQDHTKVGLPKFLITVSCSDIGNSISYDDLTGNNSNITVTSTGTPGYCFLTFPTSIAGKYIFASSSDSDGASTSCRVNNGNTLQLYCQVTDRFGAYQYGDFMVMVY